MQRGFGSFSPTEDLLERLRIGRKRFTRILNNSQQPRFEELARIAEWLDVPVTEIFNTPEEETKP